MGSPQTEIGGVTVTVGVYATRTGRSREFAVRIGRWADDKSVAKIVLGKNEFSKIVDYNRRVEWRGADGLPVIREFISAKSARYELVRDRTREAEKFTLLGFANAWAYAVNFVQFDPIQEPN